MKNPCPMPGAVSRRVWGDLRGDGLTVVQGAEGILGAVHDQCRRCDRPAGGQR